MTSARQGSIHLFEFAGVNVFLHWSWFLVAVYEIGGGTKNYSSLTWNVLEYLALFAIVLLHEFGHALACRQVGGTANHIVLWPMGGVAYVNPPQRPGATLWSIAAGPLVNVVFIVSLSFLGFLNRSAGFLNTIPNVHTFVRTVWLINVGLLIFNMLPIYPLDGGQILRSLLWFVMGRARSLMVAVVIGFAGVACLIVYAFKSQSAWIGVISAFILMNCWSGLQHARALLKMARLPRHRGLPVPPARPRPRWEPFGSAAIAARPLTPSLPKLSARIAARNFP